jgi:signal peptidase I
MAKTKQVSTDRLADLKFALLTVVFVLIAETALAQPFIVPSSSMEPTLLVGDEIAASKFAYGYNKFSAPFGLVPNVEGRLLARNPQRGDVAVFALPRDTSVNYVKRVIGLPGDRVQMKAGQLYINGEIVPRRLAGSVTSGSHGATGVKYIETLPGGREHEIIKLTDTGWANNTTPFTVPAGSYFMMGDNRDNSLDSRFSMAEGGVGFVPVQNFVGRADRILYSINPFGSWAEFADRPADLRISRVFHAVD